MIDIPKENIRDININGLCGRMTHIPGKENDKTIIYLHGQHSIQERSYSLVEYFADFGEAYAPDLPGFGGMNSFYSIGKKPTLDNYADYIYTLIKSLKINNDLYIVGISNGSQYMTRLLQKYPNLKVKKAISFVGFGSNEDIDIPRHFKVLVKAVSYFASSAVGARLFNMIVLNPVGVKFLIWMLTKKQSRLKMESKERLKDIEQLEAKLWLVNDTRTHAATTITMIKDDLRKYSDKKIPQKVYNVCTDNDQFFNNDKVRSSMLDLYEDYEQIPLELEVHAPSIVATKEEVYKMAPEGLTKLLSS